MHTSGECSLR